MNHWQKQPESAMDHFAKEPDTFHAIFHDF